MTCKDAYRLPPVDESRDASSTLDLTSGYFQIAMDDADRAKTAVTFQWLLGIVLGDLTFEVLLIYLDDIIIIIFS